MNAGLPSFPCSLCGRDGPVSASVKRCATCARLLVQASNTAGNARRVPIRTPEATAAIREAVEQRRALYPDQQDGYACAYSEILLDVDPAEHRRGDYASFDHTVPNRGERAVLCSRIVNDLKGWMTDGEFRRFICEVLDPEAPRRVHGLDEAVSREFLETLRAVMRREGSDEDLRRLRLRLKELSGRFKY